MPDRPSLTKSSLTKPWAEEQADRIAASEASSNPEEERSAAPGQQNTPRTYTRKPSFGREGKRPSFGNKPSFDRKPRVGGDRPGFGSKPSFRRDNDGSDARSPRREYTPRPGSDEVGDVGPRPRKTFSKPGTFGRKREGFSGQSFSRDNDSRPPRRDFGDKPAFSRPRKFDSEAPRPRRSFGEDRPSRSPDRSSGFPARKPYAPREAGSGPSRFGGKPSYGGTPSFDRKERGDRPGYSSEGRAGRPSGPPFRKFDAPRGARPAPSTSDRPNPSRTEGATTARGYEDKPKRAFGAKKPYSKSSGYAGKSTSSYAGKPGGKSAGKFAGKKPYGKSAATAGKPASTFDKFKDNKKPFGKRPPARKFKPGKGDVAE